MDLTAVIEQTAANLWAAQAAAEPTAPAWADLDPVLRALVRERALDLVAASGRPLLDALSSALQAEATKAEFLTAEDLSRFLETVRAALPAPAGTADADGLLR